MTVRICRAKYKAKRFFNRLDQNAKAPVHPAGVTLAKFSLIRDIKRDFACPGPCQTVRISLGGKRRPSITVALNGSMAKPGVESMTGLPSRSE
ncbi:hypothetical protein [Hoeflea halophila]|uniref:hypothetical protein n=1 Tax=Hoeflea halophila TaxID=714899 RepID=UPI0015C7C065|nr:hypothetical protein [Hoeflea halophila]